MKDNRTKTRCEYLVELAKASPKCQSVEEQCELLEAYVFIAATLADLIATQGAGYRKEKICDTATAIVVAIETEMDVELF